MKAVTVKENQSWFDLALQETGSIENMFLLMQATDAVDVTPTTGRKLLVDASWVTSKTNVDNFTKVSSFPATALTTVIVEGDGIGYWTIGTTFEVQ